VGAPAWPHEPAEVNALGGRSSIVGIVIVLVLVVVLVAVAVVVVVVAFGQIGKHKKICYNQHLKTAHNHKSHVNKLSQEDKKWNTDDRRRAGLVSVLQTFNISLGKIALILSI
jgi:flagellar basal body-associated protein FliL